MRQALAVAVLAWSTGCATAQIGLSGEASAQAERRWAGAERFLRVSAYVTPFFGDATKKFLSTDRPEHVALVLNPDGSPVQPGKPEGIVPAGTVVRVVKIEFPTPYVMATRVLFTPRTLAWVYLDVAGTPKGALPHLLVLRPGIKDEAELDAELAVLLSAEDVGKRLAELEEPVREAVRTKRAVAGMSADALTMAWGPPERKTITFDEGKKKEVWSWGGGRVSAVLLDGVVTELLSSAATQAR